MSEVNLGAGRVNSELERRTGLGQTARKLIESGQHMLAARSDEFDLHVNRQVAEVQFPTAAQDVAEHCDIDVRTAFGGGESRDEFSLRRGKSRTALNGWHSGSNEEDRGHGRRRVAPWD